MATVTTTYSQNDGDIIRLPSASVHEATPPSSTSGRVLEPMTVSDAPTNAPDISEEAKVYPTGSRFWFSILALSVVMMLGGLDNNIVATAVPALTNSFHTVADIGWYSSAFRLCTCSFQFFFAKMYTLFSLKRVFILANLVFLVGSLLCATASSSAMFIIGRAVTGFGFAGGLAGCFALLVELVPMRSRPAYTGMGAALESCAIMAAPVVGGVLTQKVGWRWCFWINLPIGAVALLLIIFLLSDPAPKPPREGEANDRDETDFWTKVQQLDLVSTCLFVPSLTALFMALAWAGVRYPWSDGRIIGLLVVFAVLLAGFAYNQYRRGDSAALPLRIVTNRTVVAGFIFTMCTNSMMAVLEYYLPTYLQIVLAYPPAQSGLLMLPILAGMLLGLVLHGLGTTLLGYYTPFMLLASACMPVAAGLMTTFSASTSVPKLLLTSGFAGFAGGIGFQAAQTAIQNTLPPKDVNLGTGVVLFGQSLGPAIAVAVAQVVFTNKLVEELGSGLVPGLDRAAIARSGLGEIRGMVGADVWPAVREGIDRSLTATWYLAVGLGAATVVGSLGMEWRSVKRKQQ